MLHALTMEYHMFFRRYRLYTILLGCTLTVGALGCAPKRVGPTAPSGYFFSLVASYSMFFGTSTEVVVRVQDAQGNPVNAEINERKSVSFQRRKSFLGVLVG